MTCIIEERINRQLWRQFLRDLTCNKTIDMSINLSDIKSRISNFKTKKRILDIHLIVLNSLLLNDRGRTMHVRNVSTIFLLENSSF